MQKAALVASAGLALSLLGTPSATAASNWNSNAPKSGTSVSTRIQANTSLGTLQLRKGKYSGNWYVWARISGPSSTANKSYDLFFLVGSPWSDQTKTDVNGTSHTKAYRLKSGTKYQACLKKKSSAPGGAYYKCVSFTG